MLFSPLIEDAVRSGAVEDSIPANQSDHVTVQQGVAPAITLALIYPLRPQFELELSGTYANSMVSGEDDFGAWDLDKVSVANAVVGFGWRYRSMISLHGGVGVTKLFGTDTGVFADGNGIRPMVEAGVSVAMPFYSALRLDARFQSHTFSTTTLRNEGGHGGNVMRLLAGASWTLGGRP